MEIFGLLKYREIELIESKISSLKRKVQNNHKFLETYPRMYIDCELTTKKFNSVYISHSMFTRH